MLHHIGVWGIRKNKCGFALAIDVAVPESGNLHLQVQDPDDPGATEEVDLGIDLVDGIIHKFFIVIDKLACLTLHSSKYDKMASASVILEGPEIKETKV